MTPQEPPHPTPARTPPRYAPGRVVLISTVLVLVATGALVFVLSQPWPQLGTDRSEAIPTAVPASSIRGIIEAHIGADRVLQVSEAPDRSHPDRRAVAVAFHAAADATHPQVIASIKRDVFMLMKALYSARQPIARVTIVAEQPYEDTFGDAKWCRITQVALSREVADRLTWQRLTAASFWTSVQVVQRPRFCP